MHRLAPVLVAEMGKAFPELARAEASIVEWLKLEETNFRRTLERGLQLLDEADERAAGRCGTRRRDRLQALRHLRLPPRPHRGCPAGQRARASTTPASRRRWSGSVPRRADTGRARAPRPTAPLWFELLEQHGKTEFLGYATGEADARIIALVVDGAAVESVPSTRSGARPRARGGDQPDAVLRRIRWPARRYRLVDRPRARGHGQRHDQAARRPLGPSRAAGEGPPRRRRRGRSCRSTPSVGDRLRRAHSATHLLHAALRHRLGDHVAQKGSLVAPDRCASTSASPGRMSQEDIQTVEREVNHYVQQNAAVDVRVMDRDDAIAERCHGALRREIRRRGPGRHHG